MEEVIAYYLRQTVLGITVVVLGFVVSWQQRRIDAKDKKIEELQDKRIADTNAYTSSYTQTTRDMVATTRDSLHALNLMQKSVDSLAGALQSLLNGKN